MSENLPNAVGPVDLEALALHVVRFSGELERAWSAALDASVLERAEEELNTELSSFVTAMNGALQEADAKLLEAGIDPKIYTFPFDPGVFKTLERTAELTTRRGQLVVSQMLALREVLEALKALHEPSGEEIDLSSGARSEWFEAGAFSLLRARSMLLLRITREINAVTDTLIAEPSSPKKLDLSIEAAVESLEAARSAYSHGDPDAALVHCRAALRGVLESMPFLGHGDERLQAPGALLAEIPSLEEYASALRLLDSETVALADRRADLAIAVPLVDGLLPVIAGIVHQPPIVELQALVAGQGDR